MKTLIFFSLILVVMHAVKQLVLQCLTSNIITTQETQSCDFYMTGTASTSNQIYLCAQTSLFGGTNICGGGCIIKKNVNIVESFWKITVSAILALLDQWQYNTSNKVDIFFDSQLIYSINYAGQIGNVCTQNQVGRVEEFIYGVEWTQKNFVFKMVILAQKSSTLQSFGFRDFKLFANYCPNYCEVCTSDTFCTTCIYGYFFYQNSCFLNCPSGTYNNLTTYQCTNCEQPCKTCTDKFNCPTCKSGYFFFENNCYTNCPDGTYNNLSTYKCSACKTECSTCADILTCKTCKPNYFYRDQQCYSTCPEGTYKNNISNSCLACMVQCKTCDNDFECLSCKGPPQFNYSSVKQCDTCPAIHSEIKFVNDFDELAIALNGYNQYIKAKLNLDGIELQNEKGQQDFTVDLCNQLFQSSFISSKLQGSILCSYYLNVIVIKLDRSSKINKDDTILINPNRIKVFFNYVECSSYLQSIIGKVKYNEIDSIVEVEQIANNNISRCEEVKIMITKINKCGQRAPVSIKWNLVVASQESPAEVNQINTNVISKQINTPLLVIPRLTLKAKGFYQFQVIIQTEFNQIYDSVLQNNFIGVTISNDDYISIDIEYDSKIVSRSKEINIRAVFFHYKCDSVLGLKVVNGINIIKIEQLDNFGEPLGINVEEQTSETFKEVTIQPFIVQVNKNYRVQATVRLLEDNLIFSQAIYEFSVQQSDQIVQIEGGNRLQSFSQDVLIQGIVNDQDYSQSDMQNGIACNFGVQVQWTCLNLRLQTDCVDYKNNTIVSKAVFTEQSGLLLKIQKRTLDAYQAYQFKLKGTRNGVVIEDQIMMFVMEYEMPPLQSSISIKNLKQRINLNDQIFIKLLYEGSSNLDNLFFSGVVLYMKESKKTIKFDYNKVRFQVWDYFNDFLSENQNGFQVRFSVVDPMFIMPAFATYELNANIAPQQCLFQNNGGQNKDALQTKYHFEVSNCLDSDTPLKYSFYFYKNETSYKQEIDNGQNVNKNLLKARSIFNTYDTVLPYGCSFIVCSIIDSYGGITNKTMIVNVNPYNGEKQSYLQLLNKIYSSVLQKNDKQLQVIDISIIIFDIISHFDVLSLKGDKEFQLFQLQILEYLQTISSYFVYASEYKIQMQITISQICEFLLDEIMQVCNYQTIQTLFAYVESIIMEQKQFLESITLDDTQMLYKYTQAVQLILKQTKIIQNIQLQQKRDQFTLQENQFIDNQYMYLVQLSSQILNTNVIPNESNISLNGVMSSQKVSFKILNEAYFTNTNASPYPLNSQNEAEKIVIDQEKLIYDVQLSQYPQTVVKYDESFPYKNQSFSVYEQKIEYLKPTTKVPISKQLVNQYDLQNQFEQNKTESLVCLQQQTNKKWTLGDCTKIVDKAEKTIKKVLCQCKSQGKQTLVEDVSSLFTENKNLQSIFSSDGITNIGQINNWYLHASIWTIAFLTVLYCLTLVQLKKIDNKFIELSKKSKIKKKQISELLFDKAKSQLEKKILFASMLDSQTNQIQKLKQSQFNNLHYDDPVQHAENFEEEEEQKNQQQSQNNHRTDNFKDEQKIQCEENLKQSQDIQNFNSDNIQTKELNGRLTQRIEEIQNNQQNEKVINIKKNKLQNLVNYHIIKQSSPNTIRLWQHKNNQIISPFSPLKLENELLNIQTPKTNDIRLKNESVFSKQIFKKKRPNNKVTAFVSQKTQFTSFSYQSSMKQEKENSNIQILTELQQLQFIKLITYMHDFFQIFTLYDQDASRSIRLTLYYLKLMYCLTINAVFTNEYTVLQKLILNVIFSLVMAIIQIIIMQTLSSKKKIIQLIGVVLNICMLGFCFYSILVVISVQSPEKANQWILFYFIQLFQDILIIGVLVSFVKSVVLKKALHLNMNKFSFIYKHLFNALRIETILMGKLQLQYQT